MYQLSSLQGKVIEMCTQHIKKQDGMGQGRRKVVESYNTKLSFKASRQFCPKPFSLVEDSDICYCGG